MLTENDASSILGERFGIDVSVDIESFHGNRTITVWPSDLERTAGFKVLAELKWRSVEIKFVPGSFARGLVNSMEASDEDQHAAFKIFAESLLEKGADLNLQINNQSFKPDKPSDWPESWNSIEISMRKGQIVLGEDIGNDIEKVFPWVVSFFGLCISLLPLEPISDSHQDHAHVIVEEGASYTVKTTRYERSSLNRAACIEIYGTTCKVCSMDFEESYGEIGKGYIHVHHKIPLSEIDDSYTVNPKEDLIPVCPNCHAMLHKRTPPFTVQELKITYND